MSLQNFVEEKHLTDPKRLENKLSLLHIQIYLKTSHYNWKMYFRLWSQLYHAISLCLLVQLCLKKKKKESSNWTPPLGQCSKSRGKRRQDQLLGGWGCVGCRRERDNLQYGEASSASQSVNTSHLTASRFRPIVIIFICHGHKY